MQVYYTMVMLGLQMTNELMKKNYVYLIWAVSTIATALISRVVFHPMVNLIRCKKLSMKLY